MVRAAAFIAFAVMGLTGAASAGVLSAADIERLRDYEEVVIPADREMPTLSDMAARIAALLAQAQGAGEALDANGSADFQAGLRDLPRAGGTTLEKMVASLQAVDDPRSFAPPEWATMLGEVKAEIAERMAYDAALLKAYQRSAAAGMPGLGHSFVRWGERPDAAAHWTRFQATLSRANWSRADPARE